MQPSDKKTKLQILGWKSWSLFSLAIYAFKCTGATCILPPKGQRMSLHSPSTLENNFVTHGKQIHLNQHVGNSANIILPVSHCIKHKHTILICKNQQPAKIAACRLQITALWCNSLKTTHVLEQYLHHCYPKTIILLSPH